MICAIVHQLTKDLTPEQIKEQGFADYYVDHTVGICLSLPEAFLSTLVSSSPKVIPSPT